MSSVPIDRPPVQRDADPPHCTLTIGATDYALRGDPAERPGATMAFRLTHPSGMTYTVATWHDLAVCDCGASGGTVRACEHVHALRHVGLLPGTGGAGPDDEALDLATLFAEEAAQLRRAAS